MNAQRAKQIINHGYLMRFFIITLIFTASFGAIIHGVQKRAEGDQGKITLVTRFWYLDFFWDKRSDLTTGLRDTGNTVILTV